MKLFKEPTIQTRFTLVLILVITLILCFISAIFIALEQRSIEADLRSQLNDATTLAQKSLSSALWQYNYEYVNDFVESLFLYRDMVYAQVMAGQDTVKIKKAPGYGSLSYAEFSTSQQFISKSANISYLDFDVGTIRICMSRDRVRSAIITEARVTVILIAFTISAIFLTILFLLKNHIFKPLAKLETSAQLIARGNLNAPIDIRGQDEISQLAATFKQMMVNLKTITASKDELDYEIQERMKAEMAMREERDRAQTYLDIAGAMLVAIDKDQKVTLINKRGCEILGCREKDIIGRNWFDDFIDAEDKEAIKTVFDALMSGEGTMVAYFENKVLSRNASPRLMAWRNTILKDKEGRIVGTLSSGDDITERRQAENRLKSSLEEKEILLREIHHRVKNNMQMIQSLLNLQVAKMQDPIFRQSLVESNNRIKSMALIHETLYKSQDIAQLNLESYFQDLISHLIKIYHQPDVAIELAFNIEQVSLDLDTSIACGLIVNELATNALKYAFPNGHEGKLSIRLQRSGNHQAELRIQDNGIGLPDGFCLDKCSSLGLRLVTMMAEDQLHGSIKVDSQAGTQFRIRFPFRDLNERKAT